MAQRLYRVPYRLHRNAAKTKAAIHYLIDAAGDGSGIRPGPDALTAEFLAGTHREAQQKLREAILPGDPRPVLGQTNVKLFVVRTPVGQRS